MVQEQWYVKCVERKARLQILWDIIMRYYGLIIHKAKEHQKWTCLSIVKVEFWHLKKHGDVFECALESAGVQTAEKDEKCHRWHCFEFPIGLTCKLLGCFYTIPEQVQQSCRCQTEFDVQPHLSGKRVGMRALTCFLSRPIYLLPRESSSSPLLTFANVEWFSPDSAITSDLTLIYQFLRSGRTNQKLLPKSAEKNGMWRRSQISRSNLQPSINFIFLLHSCSLQIDCTSIHGTNIHQASDCFDVAFVCMYSNLI